MEGYYDYEEEYSGNMPCDNTGYCAGSTCPMFFKCQGGED